MLRLMLFSAIFRIVYEFSPIIHQVVSSVNTQVRPDIKTDTRKLSEWKKLYWFHQG